MLYFSNLIAYYLWRKTSDIDCETNELSPNFDAPQAVEFTKLTLPLLWGSLKR